MWREEPSTTMVIGWDQVSGANPVLKYDVAEPGKNPQTYRYSAKPSAIVPAKGMNNHFVRLTHLNPNTTYHFVIQDSEGVSKRMSFQTTPDNPNLRLSVIAGGDSRNHRQARVEGNSIVSKLRPHFVMFGGDMTAGDTPTEWVEWMDDWQHTICSDGRLTPIVVTRGNHEASNASLVQLFDVAQPDLYYALTFGGNLLRVYTLNTLIPSGGSQRDWLEKDLAGSQDVSWRIAQYHHTIRPHTRSKPERDELLLNWSTLFHKYKLRLVVESDAHVVKWTYPIRPSNAPGSQMGFIRDDVEGTVYVGEGCWGAPLRTNNDDKVWTRNSGSFNQFKWVFVDRRKIEVRTIMIEDPAGIMDLGPEQLFQIPPGLNLWKPSNGEVVTLQNTAQTMSAPEEVTASGPPLEIRDCIARQSGSDVIITWAVENEVLGINYEVQRSVDGGRQFKTIADYRAKSGSKSTYHCPDLDVARQYAVGDLRYRLLYRDQQGREQKHESALDLTAAAPAERPREAQALPPLQTLHAADGERLPVSFRMPAAGTVDMILVTAEGLREVSRVQFDKVAAGQSEKVIDIGKLPKGDYVLILKSNGRVFQRFKLLK